MSLYTAKRNNEKKNNNTDRNVDRLGKNHSMLHITSESSL